MKKACPEAQAAEENWSAGGGRGHSGNTRGDSDRQRGVEGDSGSRHRQREIWSSGRRGGRLAARRLILGWTGRAEAAALVRQQRAEERGKDSSDTDGGRQTGRQRRRQRRHRGAMESDLVSRGHCPRPTTSTGQVGRSRRTMVSLTPYLIPPPGLHLIN